MAQTGQKIRAEVKYIKSSAIKLRRVANQVRGLNVDLALSLLNRMPQKSAELIYDALHSARANAVNNFKADSTALKIVTLLINEGPRSHRFKPRARGRINSILKPTSHIVVELEAQGE